MCGFQLCGFLEVVPLWRGEEEKGQLIRRPFQTLSDRHMDREYFLQSSSIAITVSDSSGFISLMLVACNVFYL